MSRLLAVLALVLGATGAAVASELHDTAGSGDLAAVERLLAQGAGVDACGPNAETPLMAAALAGQDALAAALLARGAFGGVAIMGYDTVAYFTDGRAVKGSKAFAYDGLGTPWYFASAEHRQLFIDDPVRYAPQYGGYCVGEVAFNGVTINIDSEAWRIIDGKLYLSYDQAFAAELEAHPEKYLAQAEANWPDVKARLEREPFN
jgi:YHS domain-containing protein